MLISWFLDILFFNSIPSFLYSIIPIVKISLPFQPPDQGVHLGGQIGNHDDQKDQQKRIGVDNPQDIHNLPPFLENCSWIIA